MLSELNIELFRENDLNYRIKMEKKFLPFLEKDKNYRSLPFQEQKVEDDDNIEEVPLCNNKLFGIKKKKDG